MNQSQYNTLTVGECIMNSCLKNKDNNYLDSTDNVKHYALAALNIKLTDHQASLIQQTCISMIKRMNQGEHLTNEDWFYDFKLKLTIESNE